MRHEYMGEYISVEVDEANGIGRIQLGREPVNAMNDQFAREIADAIQEVRFDDDVGVIAIESVVEGTFSAGGDFEEFLEYLDAGNPEGISQKTIRSREYRIALENTPKPVVAVIDGHCLAGGLELALACDFRYATPDSTFGLTENEIGAVPGGGGTQRLPRVVGREKALEMILFAERISAEEAAEAGLVNEVFDQDEFEESVAAILEKLGNGPTLAHGLSKFAVKHGMEMGIREGLWYEWTLNRETVGSYDFNEAMDAFREDREPEFEGR